MGIRIFVGSENGRGYEGDDAILFCSTSGIAFGPVFNGDKDCSGSERAKHFLKWLDSYTPNINEIREDGRSWTQYHDPRGLTELGLVNSYYEWLKYEKENENGK